MRLIVDTSRVQFTVTREAQPRKDQEGRQRTTTLEDGTKVPTWSVQLVAVDASGAEVLNVTYAGQDSPKVTVGQPVTPENLQAIPWAQNGRNGVAYRATEFKPVGSASGSKANS
jgi:hypothetical protein